MRGTKLDGELLPLEATEGGGGGVVVAGSHGGISRLVTKWGCSRDGASSTVLHCYVKRGQWRRVRGGGTEGVSSVVGCL